MSEGVTVNDINVGEISWRIVPGQEFLPSSNFLSGIELLVATFARENTCRLVLKVVRINDGIKEEIRTVERPASAFKDNCWHLFDFKPIPDSAGTTIYFYLESPDSNEGDALTVWANSSVAPPGCRMHMNHLPVPGSLCFKPLYTPLVDAAFKEEWERWAGSAQTAFAMVDGSRTEEDLRQRGGMVASVLKDALAIDSSHEVLEIGCGVGRISRELAPHSGRFTCVDISEGMLRFASRRMEHLRNVSFHSLSEKPLDEFPAFCMDRILSHLVFFHLPREQVFSYLKQVARLLAPGGACYFDTWNLAYPSTFQRWLAEVDMYRGKEKPKSYNRFCTRQEIDILVKMSGLRSVCVVESALLMYIVERAGTPSEASFRAPAPRTLKRMEEVALFYIGSDGSGKSSNAEGS